MSKSKSHHTRLAPKTLTQREISLLLTELLRFPRTETGRMRAARNYTIVLLMLDAGLRISEALNLRVGDMMVLGEPIETLIIKAKISKGLDDRQLPLTPRLRDSVTQLNNYVFVPLQMKSLDWAFTKINNKEQLNRRSVADMLSTAAQVSMQRHIHPHMLRHTFATRIVRQSSTAIAQRLLGHRYLSSTQVYTNPNQDDLKSAIEKMSQIE